MKKTVALTLVALLTVGVGIADAKDKDKGKKGKGVDKNIEKAIEKIQDGKKLKPKEKAALEKAVPYRPVPTGRFDEHERGILRECLHGYDRDRLPPGLAKKNLSYNELPPGWQQKLSRGSHVPPEVYGHFHPLPPEYGRRMPQLGSGYGYRVFEERIFKMEISTRRIIDVIPLGDLF